MADIPGYTGSSRPYAIGGGGAIGKAVAQGETVVQMGHVVAGDGVIYKGQLL